MPEREERGPSVAKRETVIAFDRGASRANILTHDFALIRALEAAGVAPIGLPPEPGRVTPRSYDVPLSWIRVDIGQPD